MAITLQCTQFESMTVKIRIKEVVNLDEDHHAHCLCQRSCVPKLALLGSAVCSGDISCRTYTRMDARNVRQHNTVRLRWHGIKIAVTTFNNIL